MLTTEDIILESCVDSLNQALDCEKKGAFRIELCRDLHLDGITPERKTIKEALSKLNIPVKIMIRPRAGNFDYSKDEFEAMISDIRYCRDIGVEEIVTGILTKEKTLDIRKLEILASIADPMVITIHKCIDLVDDVFVELERLIPIKQVKSILTSGKAATAKEGSSLIKEMIKRYGSRFKIIPAGKITKENLLEIYSLIGAKEYHGRSIV